MYDLPANGIPQTEKGLTNREGLSTIPKDLHHRVLTEKKKPCHACALAGSKSTHHQSGGRTPLKSINSNVAPSRIRPNQSKTGCSVCLMNLCNNKLC